MMLIARCMDHSLCRCGRPFVSHAAVPVTTADPNVEPHAPTRLGYRIGFDPSTGRCDFADEKGQCRCGYGNWPELTGGAGWTMTS